MYFISLYLVLSIENNNGYTLAPLMLLLDAYSYLL